MIYLVFNEGYKSSSGKEIIRKELCEEALIMNKALLDSDIATTETAALQALMLFNAARFDSRFNHTGDIVELENQDRSLWNKDFIQLGHDFLKRSYDENISPYHLEASIAYTHCMSPDFCSTDWQLISKLYLRLLKGQPNPFVELNYAISLYYAGEKEKAFTMLIQLKQHPYMNQYFVLNSALGKFYAREGKSEMALNYLHKALEQTSSNAEQKLIQRRISDL